MTTMIHNLVKNNKTLISKNSILTVLLILTSIFSFAQESTVTLTVTIDNIKNDTGLVKMALHNGDTFMKGEGLMSGESKIKDGKITITFQNVAAGDYAIIAFHDENENDRMDFQQNGMPLESYGMSNNFIAYGPPNYEDAKFNVADKDLDINIRF